MTYNLNCSAENYVITILVRLRYVWYNFNWEICYTFLEFVFSILRNLIIYIIMIIIHSSFASKILIAESYSTRTVESF